MVVASRIGVLDLGSNAIRLEVSSETAGRFCSVFREREKLSLGEPVFRTGVIPDSMIDRTVRAVRRLLRAAREHRAGEVIAVGTAALREAANRDVLVQAIEDETGVRVEVISGIEEAQLLARAAMLDPAVAAGEMLVVDVGGGSTELVHLAHGRSRETYSVAAGAVRLAQLFLLERERLRPSDVVALQRYVSRAFDAARVLPQGLAAVGASGNTRALAKLLARSGEALPSFTADAMRELFLHLALSSRNERRALPGLKAERADLIVAAAAITCELMQRFGIETMRPIESGLATGVALRARDEKCALPLRTPELHLGVHTRPLAV